jgi:hypothetical protein
MFVGSAHSEPVIEGVESYAPFSTDVTLYGRSLFKYFTYLESVSHENCRPTYVRYSVYDNRSFLMSVMKFQSNSQA